MTPLIDGRPAQGIGLPAFRGEIDNRRHPFGSMPRVFSSFLITRLIQAASDSSPSCCWACSISALSSGSKRNWKGGFPLCLFSLCVDTSITPNVLCLCVITHYTQSSTKTTKPGSVGALTGLLITTVIRVTKMTISKFTFVLAQGKQRIATMRRIRFITVLAGTEQEARSIAGAPALVFVSRCPAQEVTV